MKSGVIVKFDNIKKVADSMRALAENRVLVGVPQEKAAIDGEAATNAQIGYWQETGVPEHNLPARPHLVPGVRDSEDDWLPRLKDATKASFEGRQSGVIGNMNAAGLIAQNAVRKKIVDILSPALAVSTLKARQRYEAKKAGGIKRLKSVSTIPLLVTGAYLKSLIYVIRKGK